MSTRGTYRGVCRHCGRRRDVYACSRQGGGTYRRPNRRYSSSICGECAVDLAALWSPGHLTISRWSSSTLLDIAATLGVDGADCVAVTYGYQSGVQVATYCTDPGTEPVEGLDGSTRMFCPPHAADAIEAGGRTPRSTT